MSTGPSAPNVPAHDAAQAAFHQHQQDQGIAQGHSQSAEFFLSNYRLGKTLGVGSFGKVKVAEHVMTGHRVAIKILNRKKILAMDMDEKVRREIKILRLFMHPHIIRLYEVIETPSDIYVVMEYVKSGELFDYIVEKGRLMEEEARHFFQQIISGVEYCHRNMVVHRDLKPENLLLDSNKSVKIADFGLSNIMRDGHFLKTSCGSPNYAAPEVISGKLYAGPEVDVWSCGVILYALLCGSLPFDDENIPNLFKKIKGGIYNLPSHLSPGARDLIPRMLLVDPLKRITIPEIRQHPWFTLHLPRYLAVMQAEAVVGVPRVDEEMLVETARLGFDRELLMESIRTRSQNKATVTYYLLCDNKRRLPSSGYLRSELSEGLPPQQLPPPGASAALQSSNVPQQRLLAERKWRLGIHGRGHPSTLIAELHRVLQSQGIAWKKTAPYNLKCRKVVKVPRAKTSMSDDDDDDDDDQLVGDSHMDMGHERNVESPVPSPQTQQSNTVETVDSDVAADEMVLKFECQMYKSRDDEYLVDIQRLSGDIFIFMDVVTKLILEMRV
ncbi:hypothetical protein CEUSTIGMA_g10824.t1 [Chlamydomonas eustigma]|uniref:non-specific serine/threonine protein kinase n=1 Tax=Chlamydomonas eustigma TaxID=1157962 RepID=A0A250XKD9_9CHLO|nr:hypothetical protein CEUSTIGMA_g10824.t1 [Chlamydomonas eustigma]|eukprot:GAX83399.1 hypothetical protein CEUSTIGMA_g10824.t1 [Chlamydomonas eustigma]